MAFKATKGWFIHWNQNIGVGKRWTLACPWFSLRAHYRTVSDDVDHYHDHPWWFLTIVVRGSYVDVSEKKRDRLRLGSVRFRSTGHKHAVVLDKGPCLTFLLTGPVTQTWDLYPCTTSTQSKS